MKRYTAQEMRDMAEQILHTDDDWYEDAGHMLLQAADMMERESTSEKSSQVGNAAAMRDALLRCDAIAQMPEIREYLIVKDMRNLIKKALSAPPRDCDDLEVCSDYDESDEAIREEREAYEVDKADAKRKGEW